MGLVCYAVNLNGHMQHINSRSLLKTKNDKSVNNSKSSVQEHDEQGKSVNNSESSVQKHDEQDKSVNNSGSSVQEHDENEYSGQLGNTIGSGLDAENFIKKMLGYTNNDDIVSGSSASEEKGNPVYTVQIKSLKALSNTGGGGTIGYYKVYSDGNWKKL